MILNYYVIYSIFSFYFLHFKLIILVFTQKNAKKTCKVIETCANIFDLKVRKIDKNVCI